MALRIDTDFTVRGYYDADAEQCFFDTGSEGNSTRIENQQGGGSYRIRLGASGGGSDVQTITAAGLGGVDITSIRGFYLEIAGNVTVSIDGGAAIPVSHPGAGTIARMYMEGGPFPSITITNLGSAEIEGRIMLFGDPTS